MNRQIIFALALFSLWAPEQVHASMYCSEPRKPFCIDGSGYFDDSYAFESCKSEVETFIRNTKSYVTCLTDATNEAIEESNKVVEQFNCRAEGRSYC